MNTAQKTMSSINFVRTNVLTLFILFCFWQTGMGQPTANDRLQLFGQNDTSFAFWHTPTSSVGARLGFEFDQNFKIMNYQPAGALHFGTNNQTRMFMDNIGFVGLSNASPFALQSRFQIHENTTGADNYITFSNQATTTTGGARLGQAGGLQDFRIEQLQSANIELWAGGSQSVTVNSNGQVGISTTNPTAELHVDGAVRFENLSLSTGVQRYLTIQTNGDIGWQNGLVPLPGTSPWQTLHWNGVDWQPNSLLNVNLAGNFVSIGNPTPIVPGVIAGGTPFGGFTAGVPSAAPMLGVMGDITTMGNMFCQNVFIASDERLKKNISRLPDWKRVLDIQPYTYKYIKQEHDAYSFGFLAQDVNKVLPELTSLWGEAATVNYIGFIPFLTKGIQEHEERLNAIEQGREIPNEGMQELKVENGELKVENQILNKKVENLDNKVETLENQNEDLKRENHEIKSRLTALEDKLNSICNLPCIQNNPAPNGNGFGQTGTLGEPPALEQNEPNPFTEETVIRYFLPEGAINAKIEVRNTENKVVGSFPISQTGHGNITLSAGTLAAGNYFYSLIIDNNMIDIKKMVLLN